MVLEELAKDGACRFCSSSERQPKLLSTKRGGKMKIFGEARNPSPSCSAVKGFDEDVDDEVEEEQAEEEE